MKRVDPGKGIQDDAVPLETKINPCHALRDMARLRGLSRCAAPRSQAWSRSGSLAGDESPAGADGSADRVLFSASREQARHVRNLHLAWPSRSSAWFVASFYHFPDYAPQTYAPPLDEILQIRLDGTWRYLARSGSEYSRGAGRGSATDMFWAMPLAVPGADGSRISFNSNRSGTIDQFILYPEEAGK